MGILDVGIAALVGFAFGAAWYMSLAKPWMRAAGIEVGADGRPQRKPAILPFAIAFLCMLSVAGMMDHAFTLAAIETPARALLGGLGIGLFFIMPWMAMNYAYAMRSWQLILIDGGYSVLGAGMIGLVLGLI